MQVVLIGFLVYLLALAYYDLRELEVPINLIGAGMILVAVSWGIQVVVYHAVFWQLFFGIVPGIAFLIIAGCTDKVGLADGIVLCMVGMLLGGRGCITLLCVSLLIMTAFSVVMLLLKKVDLKSRLPFFPFMCGGYAILFFTGAMGL